MGKPDLGSKGELELPKLPFTSDHADLHRKIDTLHTQVDYLKDSLSQKDAELQGMKDYFDQTKYYIEQLAAKITGIFSDLNDRFSDLKENTENIAALQKLLNDISLTVREHQVKINDVPSSDELRLHMLSTKNEIIEELNVLKAQTKELTIDDRSLEELRDHIAAVKNDMLCEIDDLRKKLITANADDGPAEKKTKGKRSKASSAKKHAGGNNPAVATINPSLSPAEGSGLQDDTGEPAAPSLLRPEIAEETRSAPGQPHAGFPAHQQPHDILPEQYDDLVNINKMLSQAVDLLESGRKHDASALYKEIYNKYLNIRSKHSPETQKMYKRITYLYRLLKE